MVHTDFLGFLTHFNKNTNIAGRINELFLTSDGDAELLHVKSIQKACSHLCFLTVVNNSHNKEQCKHIQRCFRQDPNVSVCVIRPRWNIQQHHEGQWLEMESSEVTSSCVEDLKS